MFICVFRPSGSDVARLFALSPSMRWRRIPHFDCPAQTRHHSAPPVELDARIPQKVMG
jgi:hypothetical protein